MTSDLLIASDRSRGAVSAIYTEAARPIAVFAFAHGAGAGLRHPFMQQLTDALSERGVSVLRFNFPYLEQGRRAPDPQPVLEAYVRSACASARELAPSLPLFAGGRSMGGRMTSNAAAREPIEGLRGIVFFGFPLHAPRRPAPGREAHLRQVTVPMLFLQGTRDDLAEISLIRQVCASLPLATLKEFEDADHSFDVPKRARPCAADLREELADLTVQWLQDRLRER